MNDADIVDYLTNHAPLDSFYIFAPPGSGGVLQYFDSSGKAWNLMEDDEEIVECALGFLRKNGVKIFENYASLAEYERLQGASSSSE